MPSKMSPLLNLPWELREQIYLLVLEHDVPLRRSKIGVTYHVNRPVEYIKEIPSGYPAGLLCTCREIEAEASPIFYTRNEFVPYTSLYLDKIDHKSVSGFERSVPDYNEWTAKLDQEKHEDLGICARRMEHITSLVIYDEYAQLDRARFDIREHNQALKCSNLIAEMLLWLRMKAPQIQQLSIRYGEHRPRLLESFTKDWIVTLPHLERRLYKVVRGFPNLLLLDIRRAYTRIGTPSYWGDSEPLFELERKDHRFKGVKGRVFGDALQRATTSKWVRLGTETFQCGTRWCFVLRSRREVPQSQYLRNSYVARKLPRELPHEYAWIWSLVSKENWGRAQEAIDQAVTCSQSPRTIQLLRQSFLRQTFTSENVGDECSWSSMWDRIWALPAKTRTLVWKFSLQREVPLHACSKGEGDASIDALLKVDHRTRVECYPPFVEWNSFSLFSLPDYGNWNPMLHQNELFNITMMVLSHRVLDTYRLRTSWEFMTRLRAIHLDLWQEYASPNVQHKFNGTIGHLFKAIYAASPLLSKISIAAYMNFEKWYHQRQGNWDQSFFRLLSSFAHLREITVLFAFDETLYRGIPWMHRVREANWQPTRRTGQDGADNNESVVPEDNQLKLDWVVIGNDFGERFRSMQYCGWNGANDELEGYACYLNIQPHCSHVAEQECS